MVSQFHYLGLACKAKCGRGLDIGSVANDAVNFFANLTGS